jgi:hypothetical protein
MTELHVKYENMSLVTCRLPAEDEDMTPQTSHRPTNRLSSNAVQWRHLIGPGHQFPVMTDTVLGYWPGRR